MKVRFRRFRLISIDTHLWSEHDKQENNIGGERPPNSAACQFGVWLHEQVDDPT
mgnify:CR=1 FL=1